MKKLTESDKKRIKNYFVKKYGINEGFIEWLFGKALVRRLENDPEFVKKAKELDKLMAGSKDLDSWLKAPKGTPPPPSVLRAIKTGSYK